MAKVSCSLRHRCVQLILAYRWARPAVVVAGIFYFVCFFTFIPITLSSLSLSFIFSTISSLFSPFLWEKTKSKPTRVDVSLNPNTFNQYKEFSSCIHFIATSMILPVFFFFPISITGPSCSKLTTSLVNDSLKFTSSDKQICWNSLLKKCE